MSMPYFFAAFALSIAVTWLTIKIASRLRIVDQPDAKRKRHLGAVPLLGGVAIFSSFWILIFYLLGWHQVRGLNLIANSLVAAFVGGIILVAIGIADDIKPFSAKFRLVLVIGGILMVALWIGGFLEKITNPFGGIIQLVPVIGTALTFVWLLGTTYTTKILDGLDGLATGVVAIGALMIYFLTSLTKFYQPNVALVALIFAGTCAGFLVFNFHPAKIFLGESGSLLIGYMLGILAVIGGGKLATALLVMAVPILDVVRVIYVRLRRRQSVFVGDREHLHFQLRDLGWSDRRVVLCYYAVAAVFGLTTLVLQSYQKLVALLFLAVVMAAVGWKLSR